VSSLPRLLRHRLQVSAHTRLSRRQDIARRVGGQNGEYRLMPLLRTRLMSGVWSLGRVGLRPLGVVFRVTALEMGTSCRQIAEPEQAIAHKPIRISKKAWVTDPLSQPETLRAKPDPHLRLTAYHIEERMRQQRPELVRCVRTQSSRQIHRPARLTVDRAPPSVTGGAGIPSAA
jgi:hypothetical protein